MYKKPHQHALRLCGGRGQVANKESYLMTMKRGLPFFLIALVVLAVVPAQKSSVGRGAAQTLDTPDPSRASVVIQGVVQSINGNTWIVDKVPVQVSPTTVITGYPVVGSIVKIVGTRGGNGTIVVNSVGLTPATPQATSAATSSGTSPATPVGIVSATRPGTGTPTPAGTMVGTLVPFRLVIIEGPVEAVNVTTHTVVVVYGQHIQLRDDDPLRLKVKVGDWIHISGDYQDEDGQIVVVAVVVVVIMEPAPITGVPSGGDHHPGDNDWPANGWAFAVNGLPTLTGGPAVPWPWTAASAASFSRCWAEQEWRS